MSEQRPRANQTTSRALHGFLGPGTFKTETTTMDERNPTRGHGHQHSREGGGGGGRGGYGGGGGGPRGRHEPDHDGRGVPLSELDPALTEVSRKLIGCAIEVHKALGPGFDKEVYRGALEVELRAAAVEFKTTHAFPVTYKGERVGERAADLVVADRFVVEILAQRSDIGAGERAGVRALLRAADMELGLIINFAERRLKDGLVRVLNPEKLNIGQQDEDQGGGGGGGSSGSEGGQAALGERPG